MKFFVRTSSRQYWISSFAIKFIGLVRTVDNTIANLDMRQAKHFGFTIKLLSFIAMFQTIFFIRTVETVIFTITNIIQQDTSAKKVGKLFVKSLFTDKKNLNIATKLLSSNNHFVVTEKNRFYSLF